MKKVMFISEIYPPDVEDNSTHIMTQNILNGLIENDIDLTFVVLYDNVEADKITDYFKSDKYKLLCYKSQKGVPQNKYDALVRMFALFFKKSNISKEMIDILNNQDVHVIVHIPSIETALIARDLKRIFPNLTITQYWSDPIYLSNLNYDKFHFERLPYYWLEKKVLTYGDDIVYGTKTLYEFESKLFKRFKNRMRYIDVAYIESNKDIIKCHIQNEIVIGYTGNYYSNIRNIEPLCQAIAKVEKDVKLHIYGEGDISVDYPNVCNFGRIKQSDVAKKEAQFDILVCVLNRNSVQLPGKIFYNVNLNTPILILLDGFHSNEFYDYLKDFNRFEFCDNNAESIAIKINQIIEESEEIDLINIERLSPKSIAKDLMANKK